MNEIKRYLVEEIALDHADGFLTRREALRRLGLLGVSAAAASTMLAACVRMRPPATAPSTTPNETPPPVSAVTETEAITFPGPEGRTIQGSWAEATEPRGAILVIHENKGLTEHFRTFPGRFAAVGYSALAIDLLSPEGGTAALGDPANATAALGAAPPERFDADMAAGLDELARRTPGKKLGAIGFCFGGAMTWRLVGAKDPRLAAAIPFYGRIPEGADFTGSQAAVLGIYAEKDERVNSTREAARAALVAAGLTHEIVTYPGVDHAFFNDTGPRYNAEAAGEAWKKVLSWFGQYVG